MPTWNRFVRFVADDGQEYGGEPQDPAVDVGLALLEGTSVLVNVLSDASPLRPDATFTGEAKLVKKLLCPVPPSAIPAVKCVGLNYKAHAAELGFALPTAPEIFLKPTTAVVGPADPIHLPAAAPAYVDAEVELAVVLARDCKDATPETALDFVLAYTAANDVTCRDLQGKGSQWCFCKGFDSFCPIGPALVSPALVQGTAGLALKTTLDGSVLQDSRTDDMIFSVAQIIAHLSTGTTLPQGTVILTGTPQGIGHSFAPPRYLHAGADYRLSIGGGIGTLTNPIAEA